MRVEKFKVKKQNSLLNILAIHLPNISKAAIKNLLKNKDIKVDGVRIKENIVLSIGQEVEVYLQEKVFDFDISIVYEDDNIVIVNKSQGIETINDEDTGLDVYVSRKLGVRCYAVHRLDRNTMGLVIFAKNENAKSILDDAFKQRIIKKYYVAWVYGVLKKSQDNLISYLKKDKNSSFVQIFDKKVAGSDLIQTNYKVLSEQQNTSLVEVELITGKTHQIRAHMSHIGHFVIGDEKYGDTKINKIYSEKKQCLCAYKIFFENLKNELTYLNGKTIKLDINKIPFVEKCKNL